MDLDSDLNELTISNTTEKVSPTSSVAAVPKSPVNIPAATSAKSRPPTSDTLELDSDLNELTISNTPEEVLPTSSVAAVLKSPANITASAALSHDGDENSSDSLLRLSPSDSPSDPGSPLRISKKRKAESDISNTAKKAQKQDSSSDVDDRISEFANVGKGKSDKLAKLKRALLNHNDPHYLIFIDKSSSEEKFEDLLCNCIKMEISRDKSNYSLLCLYYRIGFFLLDIFKKLKTTNPDRDEKFLVTGIIKGCGIANLYRLSDGVYEESTRKRSVKFYNTAIRTFKIYSCFPCPINQIARTASRVYVSNLIEIGNSDNFELFLEQISEEIQKNLEIYNYNNEIETNHFNLELITDNLLSDIQKYINNPSYHLKESDIDSIGLIRTNSFVSLLKEGKIKSSISTNFERDL